MFCITFFSLSLQTSDGDSHDDLFNELPILSAEQCLELAEVVKTNSDIAHDMTSLNLSGLRFFSLLFFFFLVSFTTTFFFLPLPLFLFLQSLRLMVQRMSFALSLRLFALILTSIP